MFVSMLVSTASAGTVTLTSSGAVHPSLQSAIDAAVSNDVIVVTGTVVEGDVVVDRDLSFVGPGTLQVNQIHVNGKRDATFQSLVITGTGGSTPIASDGNLFLDDCEVSGSGLEGGAIAVTAGTAEFVRTRIVDSDAAYGGGLFVQGTVGAPLSVTLLAVEFVDTSADIGGAIYAEHADITCLVCSFERSAAWSMGGAVQVESGSFSSFVDLFLDVSAPDGAAILSDDAELTLDRSRFCGSSGGATVSSTTDGSVRNVVFGDSDTPADLEIAGAWAVENNHFVNGGTAIDIGPGSLVEVENNVFVARTGTVIREAFAGTTLLRYSLFDVASPNVDNIPLGTGVLTGIDPELRPLDCVDTMQPDPGSPLIDAGDPAVADPDGSRSDIGAFGGLGADPTGFQDHDGDGLVWADDCDDEDAVVFGPKNLFFDGDGDGRGGDPSNTHCHAPGWVAIGGDCNDEDASVTTVSDWHPDSDGDGAGNGDVTVASCGAPVGHVTDDSDCNDTDADAFELVVSCADVDGDGLGDFGAGWAPGATAFGCGLPAGSVGNCDDCDDGDSTATTFVAAFVDGDGDGWGTSAVWACAGQEGTADVAGDCDDGVGTTFPGAPEVCDGVDDNCADGTADEPVVTLYADVDGDGAGDAAAPTSGCGPAPGLVLDATDCAPSDPAVFPGAAEFCDGIDQNCVAGATDEPTVLVYRDADGDGAGDPAEPLHTCVVEPGWVPAGDDCDDTSAAVVPGAVELCDGIDQNCVEGVTDEPVEPVYQDLDGDRHGDPAVTTGACGPLPGWSSVPDDCDDTRDTVHPGAPETCDGLDEDCSGTADDLGVPVPWYTDSDGDGFGDPEVDTFADCRPAGTTSDATDCDDTDASVNPSALEVCNGVDDDCSGGPDDVGATIVWYVDDDGDGHGNPASGYGATCAPDGTWVEAGDDCNDLDATLWSDCALESDSAPTAAPGCGCSAARTPTVFGWFGLGFVGLGVLRRRRV